MVKVRDDLPRLADGTLDLRSWTQRLAAEHGGLNPDRLFEVCDWTASFGQDLLFMGLELAELVAQLKMDQSAVFAALVYRGVRRQIYPQQDLQAQIGSDATRLVNAVAAMATTSLLEMSNSALLEKEQQDQVENIKRMLVSMIDDARVAVVKLAERVLVLRHAKDYDPVRRQRIAQEASDIFAPLAGRLGIWQLKWELEDLSLRYTQEEVYKHIAAQLQGKRAEREAQVELMVDQVRALLRGHGIEAAVFGRAKHIYSIWRKMQKKGVSLDQVYDVRAVRVVVDNLAQCYAALGIIHTTWQHIPSEFDDYVAMPKENGYQSIHTAVTANDGKTLEIQIRTMAMHEDAELGVCAHWSYKDGAGEEGGYSAKMDWLRQVMEWHDELDGTETIGTLLQHRVSDARIYVSTPKGHVLDLPVGSTVLDFAFRIHTDVGLSCIGARIEDRSIPVWQTLQTGQQVEVITDPGATPQREWLEPELGFVHTDRARAKLVHYFRTRSAEEKQQLGEALLVRYLSMLVSQVPSDRLLARLQEHWQRADQATLLSDLGAGVLSLLTLLREVLQQPAEFGLELKQLPLPGVSEDGQRQVTRFKIIATNRDGLLRDLTSLVASLKQTLTASTGRVSNDATQAIITLDVSLDDWSACIKLASFLCQVEGVTQVQKQTV